MGYVGSGRARSGWLAAGAAAFLAFPAISAVGAPEFVTAAASGGPADDDTWEGSVTPNGRYVVFDSRATNLGLPSSPGVFQIVLHDRRTGERTLLSAAEDGAPGNGNSFSPVISKNGRTVAFSSKASNLAEGGTGIDLLYVLDRRTGTLAQHPRNAEGALADASCTIYGNALSSNGRYVVFYSAATNLVPGADLGQTQCYLLDTRSGAVTLVSADAAGLPGTGNSLYPSISSNGRFAAFQTTSSNLLGGEGNGFAQIVVRDLRKRVNRVATVDGSGALGNGDSNEPVVSSNGRIVAFFSAASNLGPTDANGLRDAYLRDLRQPAAERLTLGGNGSETNDHTGEVAMSANGSMVAFYTRATNLLDGVTSPDGGTYVLDRKAGVLTQVDLGPAGELPDGDPYVWPGGMDPTGRWLFFATRSDAIAGGNALGQYQGYVIGIR